MSAEDVGRVIDRAAVGMVDSVTKGWTAFMDGLDDMLDSVEEAIDREPPTDPDSPSAPPKNVRAVQPQVITDVLVGDWISDQNPYGLTEPVFVGGRQVVEVDVPLGLVRVVAGANTAGQDIPFALITWVWRTSG